MSSDAVISVNNLSKCYHIYAQPRDRLKQFFFPKLQKIFGLEVKTYYQEFWALKNVSFEVKKGETVGILGKNGSGKSTLLQIITGTLGITDGDVSVKGRVAALLELGSGFNPDFSGRENVYMNGALLGLTNIEIDERFEAIVKFAEIGDFIDQPVKTYSSGMMLRLAFAVIAHVDADVLIVDEALAVGDALFTQKCMRFLREFMKNGSILFVSHDTGAVLNLCNAAVLLNHGDVAGIGAPKTIVEMYMAMLYESHQEVDGIVAEPTYDLAHQLIDDYEYKDMREAFINNSNLRNDIEIFRFQHDGNGFGSGDAEIIRVRLLDMHYCPLAWAVGGEDVVLEITCSARANIMRPIVGFDFKDRLGQSIFVDNTFLEYKHKPIAILAGQKFITKFAFRMPILPTGDYSFTIAVADGTQDKHIQLHYKHDALIVKVHSSSSCLGLIGIPMRKISIEPIFISEQN